MPAAPCLSPASPPPSQAVRKASALLKQFDRDHDKKLSVKEFTKFLGAERKREGITLNIEDIRAVAPWSKPLEGGDHAIEVSPTTTFKEIKLMIGISTDEQLCFKDFPQSNGLTVEASPAEDGDTIKVSHSVDCK